MEDVEKLIDEKITEAMSFSVSKYGDTPTDALQLTPKKYVDGRSGVTSIGITPGASISVSGSPITSSGNITVAFARRVVTVTQSATPTINTDNTDVANITGLAQAITSMTTNLSGTPNPYDSLIVCITDNGTARAITWGTKFEPSTVPLPTTTSISALLMVGFFWNSVSSKWHCVAVS